MIPVDIKLILKNPNEAIKNHWGSINNCDELDTIIETIEDIKCTTSGIKTLKEDKNRCASLFKKNKYDPALINQLKIEMSSISARLNEKESIRKTLNERLLTHFKKTNNNKAQNLPKQFLPHQSLETTEHNNIDVRLIADDEATAWDDYVNRHPNSNFYHSYAWRKIIQKSFNHESYYLVAVNDSNSIVGILPIIRLKSYLFGNFAVSVPFFNYGGPLADNPEITKLILDNAAQHCNQHGIKYLEIRSTERLNNWPSRSEKVSMIKKIPPTVSELNQELGSKIRAQINRAKSENVRADIGGIHLLDDFYKVFSINMRDLGTPVYGKKFFKNILEQWPENANIAVVYLDNKPVSTAFLLSNKDMVEIPWASTLRKANPMSINMLLYWEVLIHSIANGYTYFDFGRSTLASNTYKFKKQWGAKPVTHYWHYWLGDNEVLPELNPNNPKFKLLINIWRKLPVVLTRIIGPPIVKNLP